MKVSIHQPNYIPWLGFFNKIIQSDIYIVFDDVQFPRGKDFAYRNKIKTPQGGKWLSLPVSNKSQLVEWRHALLSTDVDWRTDHLNQITAAYRNAPYYSEVFDMLEKIYDRDYNSVEELNLTIIEAILDIYNWHGTIIKSSELNVNERGLEKIIGLLNEVKATTYITGVGAGSQRYIDESIFKDNNIVLQYQQFNHPEYNQQHGAFEPYMSIIDLLFNEGFNSKQFVL
jgi:hypothetical protein